jgi:hypothetical protein
MILPESIGLEHRLWVRKPWRLRCKFEAKTSLVEFGPLRAYVHWWLGP